MSWVAVAVGFGSAVVGAAAQDRAGDKAADARQNASNSSIAEQRRRFDLMRQDQMPWLQAGQWALPKLQETYDGNFTGFLNSPDYLATQQQGLSFMDRSAASRGALFSGGHSADLMKYGQGLAAQQLSNYRGGLAGLAGVGQSSAQNIGAAGMGMANSISNLYTNAGNARATAYQNQGNNLASLMGAVGSGVNQGYYQNSYRNGGGTGWYFGNQPGRG